MVVLELESSRLSCTGLETVDCVDVPNPGLQGRYRHPWLVLRLRRPA